MASFRGTFDYTLDAKNRLTVPARFRAALAGAPLDRRAAAVSAITAVVICALAVYVFRRTEDTFADVI